MKCHSVIRKKRSIILYFVAYYLRREVFLIQFVMFLVWLYLNLHLLQILRVLLTILDTSGDPRSLSVACFDLSQFVQHHPAGRIIVTDLKAKERVMKLMNHENAEVTKNALLCIQRLFLGAKYASFLQVQFYFALVTYPFNSIPLTIQMST